jgi:hypothetical protein
MWPAAVRQKCSSNNKFKIVFKLWTYELTKRTQRSLAFQGAALVLQTVDC